MTAVEGLAVEDLTVAFGGHVAVDKVTLEAPVGRITGLIGPNGAGKTTTFNACCGLLTPRSGSVRAFGVEVTGQRSARRARHGLGRTFQRVELCPTMTVRDNVLVGVEARQAGCNPFRQVVALPRARRAASTVTDEALHRCGITELAERRVELLSTGQRRLVELARVLAGGFRVLLLDEPSSGLDDAETRAFGEILAAAVATTEVGVLLVEHDMELVMAVCEHLFVLDFGCLLFEGTPAETRASHLVRAAYLGDVDAQPEPEQ